MQLLNAMQAMLQHFGIAMRGYVAAATGAAAAGLAAAGVEISLPQVHMLHSFYTSSQPRSPGWPGCQPFLAAVRILHSAYDASSGAVVGKRLQTCRQLVLAIFQEAGLLAAFLRQLEAAGDVPVGQLAAHVPGLVLEAHHLAAL